MRLFTLLVGLQFLALLPVPCPAAAAGGPYDIPRLDDITIDGRAQDWGDKGFRVDAMSFTGFARPAADYHAVFRLAWDQTGLLVLVHVSDDEFVEAQDEARLWSADSIELFAAQARGAGDIHQIVAAPGLSPTAPALRQHLHDHRQDAALLWYPEPGASGNSQQMHTLRLAAQPGAPVQATAFAGYERFRRVRVGKKERLSLTLPDLEEQKRLALHQAQLEFGTFVLDGPTFPGVEFTHPSLVEHLRGESSR